MIIRAAESRGEHEISRFRNQPRARPKHSKITPAMMLNELGPSGVPLHAGRNTAYRAGREETHAHTLFDNAVFMKSSHVSGAIGLPWKIRVKGRHQARPEGAPLTVIFASR